MSLQMFPTRPFLICFQAHGISKTRNIAFNPDIFFVLQVCVYKPWDSQPLTDDQLTKAICAINRQLQKLYRSDEHVPFMHQPAVLLAEIDQARQNRKMTSFLSLDQPFMEILYIKGGHWLLVTNFGKDHQQVSVYDSLHTFAECRGEVFEEVSLVPVCY